MSLQPQFKKLIENGQSSGRLWLYSNYHCNLECRYCLTASSPRSPVRGLTKSQMLEAVRQAKKLGFTSVGITGGEPFLQPWLPDVLADIAELLPVIVLTNGTMLTRPSIRQQLLKSKDLPMQIQISVDDPDPVVHDSHRGNGSFRRAIQGIPWLIEQGVSVRISSTRSFTTDAERDAHDHAMCQWMLELGLVESDHVARTMVQRGQALQNTMGVQVGWEMLPADLTLTRMGAFYSPFAPTFVQDRLQTDMLLTRTILPLSIPLKQLIRCLDTVSPEQRAASDASGFV